MNLKLISDLYEKLKLPLVSDKLHTINTGLKVNDQLVAYEKRLLAVHLKNHARSLLE